MSTTVNILTVLQYTVMEQKFLRPFKFYTILKIIMKYMWKNLFCVSRGMAALDRQTNTNYIFFCLLLIRKTNKKILNSFNLLVLNIVGIKVNK